MVLTYAKVKIRGTKPLLIHCFTTETLSLERKERSGVAGNDPEEWKRTFMATSSGQLYVDSSYVFGCLRDAAKHTKSGRGSIQSKLAATLQVINDKALFNRYMPKNLNDITNDETQPVYLDIRSVKNPGTKARNIRYRLALSPFWETEFEIVWESTIVATSLLPAILRDAGMLVGLADGRSIGYGRFEVISFEPKKYNDYQKSVGEVSAEETSPERNMV